MGPCRCNRRRLKNSLLGKLTPGNATAVLARRRASHRARSPRRSFSQRKLGDKTCHTARTAACGWNTDPCPCTCAGTSRPTNAAPAVSKSVPRLTCTWGTGGSAPAAPTPPSTPLGGRPSSWGPRSSPLCPICPCHARVRACCLSLARIARRRAPENCKFS